MIKTRLIDDETLLRSAIDGFNMVAEHIKVNMRPPNDYNVDYYTYRDEDSKLLFYAFGVLLVYTTTLLGTCSPIHCRVTLALWSMILIVLSTYGAFGLCYLAGWKYTDANGPIPVIMVGIGMDDIFVICNALDQVSLKLPAATRLRLAVKHAGPSITITSLTNAFAFLAAMTSPLLAF